MSIVRRAVKEARTVWRWYEDTSRIPRNSEIGYSPSGVPVTEALALALSAVTSCVTLISDAIADFPIDVYRKTKGVREELAAPSLIADPFVDANPDDGIYQSVYSLLMRGNWYSLIAGRDSMQRVTALKAPTHPDLVDCYLRGGELQYKIAGKPVNPAEIVHVKAMSIPGQPKGLDPISFAQAMFGLGLAQQEYSSRFFRNDASAGVVITTPSEMKTEQIDEMVDRWKSHHAGVFRAHEPGVLTGGASVQSLTVEPRQAQFLEARRFQTAEVARFFRVPPHMIGDVDRSTSWGSGIEVQGIGFVTYTLRSWIRRVEGAFSRLLPRPQYARLNISALVRADLMTRLQAYQMGRNAGLWNIDEIRALEDLPPLPDDLGQDWLQPLNYIPVDASKPQEPPASPPPPAD